MKNFFNAMIFVVLISLSCFVQAKPSCADLDEVATVLDQVAEAFEQTGEIREGGEIDNALGSLVEALFAIADSEGDRRLSRNVESLADGWENMDADGFANSLDGIITNLDRLYRRDCE